MSKKPNMALRKALFDIVRKQVRGNNPPETRVTLERLMAAGHTREEATELIAMVVSSEIFDVLKEMQPYNESRYVSALRALPRLPWDD